MIIFSGVSKELINLLTDLVCINGYKLAFVGTELRSDDIIGLYIHDELRRLGVEGLIKCEYGLENCIDDILNIEKLLIVDAVICECDVGSIILADIDELPDEAIVTTHSIPLKHVVILARKIGSLRHAKILGIRVKSLDVGNEMSPEVAHIAKELVKILYEILTRRCTLSSP